MALLKTELLTKNFGSLQAVSQVDLEVKEGKVYSIIGPNGAGKTTLFNLISGNLEPSSGAVTFRDRVISGLKPYQISHLGIGRSFQLNNLFPVSFAGVSYIHAYINFTCRTCLFRSDLKVTVFERCITQSKSKFP